MKASQTNLHAALFAEIVNKLTPEEIWRISGEDMHVLVAEVNSEMELRVGERLSAALSDAEIEEFANIIDDPEAGEMVSAFWVAAHCPNYREVVEEAIAEVVEETVEVIAARLRVELAG